MMQLLRRMGGGQSIRIGVRAKVYGNLWTLLYVPLASEAR
jgi:hypothetical protein